VVELLIKNKQLLLNNSSNYDDVVMGIFLKRRGIRIRQHKRTDFFNLNDWHRTKNNIPSDVFHFRIKNNSPKLRLTDDVYIQSQLLHMFYPEQALMAHL
jgi:hypothetical protein